MTTEELCQLLINSGYDNGWAIAGETLVIWEHEAEPPAPLVRPVAAKTTK
jgi:hypothetical protein